MKRWLVVIGLVAVATAVSATSAVAQNPLDVLSNPGLSYGYPYPHYYAAPYAYGYPPYYYGYPAHYGPYIWGAHHASDYQRRLYEQQREQAAERSRDVHYHYHYHYAR